MIDTSISRRRLIRAMGLGAGASLVTPLLRQTIAAGGGPPSMRVVICMNGNGIERHNFVSSGVSQLDPDANALQESKGGLESAPALAALAGDYDLRPHTTVLLGLSSTITGGSHTAQYKSLSCSKGRAQTVDSWLAECLHSEQPFRALRLGTVESENTLLQYGMCMDNPSRQLPIITSPIMGHATIFGSLAGGDAGRMFSEQTKLYEFALQDAKRTADSFVGGSRERAKIDNYIAALEEQRTLQQRLVSSRETLQSVASANGIDPQDGTLLQSAHPLTRLEAQYRLAAAALMGDLTRTVVLTSSVGHAFSHTKYTSLDAIFREDANYDGVPWRHGVCHEAGGNATFQKVLDRVVERQIELIAQLARDLAAVPEGDGTMLDHTVIVFMSDNGGTHHSTAENWPTLVMGGSALGLAQGGRTLVYPRYGKSANRRVSNLFSTFGHIAGYRDEAAKFGSEPDKETNGGPLDELLA